MAYTYFKVFPHHVGELMNRTMDQFVENVLSSCWEDSKVDIKVIVLWRRRVIESYVSMAIALETGAWIHSK